MLAKNKGVRCEVESEGSLRQTPAQTYKNLIEGRERVVGTFHRITNKENE